MFKALISSLLLGTFSLGVSAQELFQGFYGQLGAGYQTLAPANSINVIFNGATIPSSLNSSRISDIGVSGAVGYTGNLDENFTFGIGFDYSPIKSSGNQQVLNVLNKSVTIGQTQVQNSYNFFLAPGLKMGDDSLLYMKAGYTGMKVSAREFIDYTGYSLGIGYKQMIASGLYGFGELNYAVYGNQDLNSSIILMNRSLSVAVSSSLSFASVLVGVGYYF